MYVCKECAREREIVRACACVYRGKGSGVESNREDLFLLTVFALWAYINSISGLSRKAMAFWRRSLAPKSGLLSGLGWVRLGRGQVSWLV